MISSLQANNISKEYNLKDRKIIALSEFNYTFLPHKMYAIVGKSGCGKSTLLNLLGLAQPPSSGEVTIDSNSITAVSQAKKARIRNAMFGYLIQDFALLEDETTLENIRIPLYYSNKTTIKKVWRKRSQALLKQFGVEEHKNTKVVKLSGGQRQRIALARALINNPEILLADEPTGQLDGETTAVILKYLRQLADEGKIVIVASHDKTLMKQCDVIIELAEGSLVAVYESPTL